MKKEFKKANGKRIVNGVGFIKSRKSDAAICEMAKYMDTFASEKKQVELEKILVDQSAGQDIDRNAIDELMAWMEKEEIKVVFVRRIEELTNNPVDLFKFLQTARDLSVSVYDMEKGVCCFAEVMSYSLFE